MINYVCGFAFNRDLTCVQLILKNKPAWQRGFYNGIGGKTKADEDGHEAMVREFLEETGLRTHMSDWEYVGRLWRAGVFNVSFFKACLERFADAKTMTDEVVCPCAIASLPPNVILNLKWIIPFCLDGHVGPFHIENTGSG